jgi:IS5 family transposase
VVRAERVGEAPSNEGQPVALRHEGAHGVDAASGLVHTVLSTAANAADVTHADQLLHGAELDATGDAGYQGLAKRNPEAFVTWHAAMRPDRSKAPTSEGATAVAGACAY